MDPKGKIAIVTGGAAGIGLAVAKELLHQGVEGLSICDVNVTKGETEVKQLQQQFGKNKAVFIKTDVTKEDEVEAAFKETIKQYGGVDIVFNNAGICNDNKWQYCISVNVNGIIQTALLALKYMGTDQGGKGGVIVNTASIAAMGCGSCATPIYSATKSAVLRFSTTLGTDFHMRRSGVKVMCICPGYTKTEIISPMLTSPVILTARDDWMPEFIKSISTYHAPQKVENVSKAVLHMIREGDNGSVWISDFDEPPYEIKIPVYTELRA